MRRCASAMCPVELVVYPREGHGVQERDHVQDMEERILRWLKTYL